MFTLKSIDGHFLELNTAMLLVELDASNKKVEALVHKLKKEEIAALEASVHEVKNEKREQTLSKCFNVNL